MGVVTAIDIRAGETAAMPSEPPLHECARRAIQRYLADLDGAGCEDLYRLFLQQVEAPLLSEVLRHCNGNLSQAARILGINRGTLRKRMDEFGLAAD